MHTLFPIEPAFPEGFEYLPAFLSKAEEAELCHAISNLQLKPFIFQGYEAKRRVASFGQDWSFEHQRLSAGKVIPDAFHPLIEKVARHLHLEQEAFAELLVTEYPPGAVINWHRDAPPFGLIAGISLQTDCTFQLRPYDKAKQNRAATISFPVQRRSLYVIQGAARSEWQHAIKAVNARRYSITLRTLQTGMRF